MKLYELKPAKGSTHRKKIMGKGPGSGHGGTSGRGHKGQNARSGGGTRLGFEGGQMPLVRRIPKRGFNNRFRKVYEIVNIDTLAEVFSENDVITPDLMREMGIIRKKFPVKVLGGGEIDKKLTVKADAFTKSAEDKIKAKKGSAERI